MYKLLGIHSINSWVCLFLNSFKASSISKVEILPRNYVNAFIIFLSFDKSLVFRVIN